MWAELQLSTQLAEVITSLTHGLYEKRRAASGDDRGGNWKWDAGSPLFRSAYLGHGLHLLEGVIQTFRDDVLDLSPKPATSETDAAVEEVRIEIPASPTINNTSSGEDKT